MRGSRNPWTIDRIQKMMALGGTFRLTDDPADRAAEHDEIEPLADGDPGPSNPASKHTD
jgi:hypothetical protein